MTRTTADLASAIRTAVAMQNPHGAIAAVCQLWADPIEVVHHPPIKLDGLREVGEAYQTWAREWFTLGRAMPDFSMDAEVATSGEKISVRYGLSGTSREGPPVRATLNVVYTTAHGMIVKSEAFGGEGTEDLVRVLVNADAAHGAAANTPK